MDDRALFRWFRALLRLELTYFKQATPVPPLRRPPAPMGRKKEG